MVLRMKNFDILGFTEKSHLKGEGFMKDQYRGGIAEKGWLGQFADLRGGDLARRGRGGDTPMHTMPLLTLKEFL